MSKKMMINNMQELKGFCEKYNSIESMCNDFIKLQYGKLKDMKKLIERYKNYKPNDNLYYLGCYIWRFKLPEMINKYYDSKIFTSKRLDQQIIVSHGHNFADGFAGITIKKMSYSDEYILEILDGENGQQFCKTYKELPTKDNLIYDTLFKHILDNNHNTDKQYKLSIYEMFSN